MIEYQRDDAKRRLRWVARGEVTLAEIVEMTTRQVADDAWTYAVLYDARDREGSLTADELRRLTAVVAEYHAQLGPRGRLAIVSGDAYGKSRMLALIGERLAGDNQVFRNVSEAERWLDDG